MNGLRAVLAALVICIACATAAAQQSTPDLNECLTIPEVIDQMEIQNPHLPDIRALHLGGDHASSFLDHFNAFKPEHRQYGDQVLIFVSELTATVRVFVFQQGMACRHPIQGFKSTALRIMRATKPKDKSPAA